MEEPIIDIQGLTRRFGPVTAVDRLSLAVPKGELFGLVGPDGAGKTTTLRMLAGILAPTGGDARVAGWSIRTAPEAVKDRIAYMSQRFGLYGDLTVLENLLFYADLFEVPRAERPARIERLLGASQLTPFKNRLADELSGGMKQKLGLACALVHTPEIVLLDEPTNGVDPVSRRAFWDLIRTLARDGVTVSVTTHYMDEAEYCDRLALIYRGRMIALGTPDQLKRDHMPEDVLEVAVDRPVEALEALSREPSVREAAISGALLHVVVPEAAEGATAVRAALERSGVGVSRIEPILPSLEDVFVSLIEAEDRKEAR